MYKNNDNNNNNSNNNNNNNNSHSVINVIRYSHGQIKVDILIFYYIFLLHSIVYNNEMDKFVNKIFRILYLQEIAFNLIPQQLLCTKAKNIRELKRKYDFAMSMPSCRVCCTIMVHFIGAPIMKSCSSSLTPCDFTILSKIIIIVSS